MAEGDQGKLPGVEKAAIFLMMLGEEAAAEVMKNLGPKEVQKIGVSMASLQKVQKWMVHNTLDDFINDIKDETALGLGAEEYIRNVLIGALGEEKAGSIIDRIMLGVNTKGLESLKWMDSRGIVELIRNEHPQIIAIVLSYLDGDQAAEVLSEFPEKVRSDVLLRIATLDSVQPAAMHELNDILEKQLRGVSSGQASSIGGVKTAANILNYLESSIESNIMQQVADVDSELATEIEDLMFTFENLVDVDDRGIQTLLREVSSDNLVIALKGADEIVREKIFRNMSQRAGMMLREDLESRGPIRLSEVETAQKEILAIARRLSEQGQIVLGGAGGEKLV